MTYSKEPLDLPDLGAALPPTAPGLGDGEEVQAALVKAPYDGSVMKSLTPKIKKRVEFLQGIQTQHDELQAKFYEERAALEAKYQKLYKPLYAKRFEVVNGVEEVEGNTFDNAEGATSTEETGIPCSFLDTYLLLSSETGIPCFWLTAMNTNPVLVGEISVRDVDALMYLKDIKWCRIDDPKGFKLDFFFDSNPFFKNSILTKTYHIVEDEEPILEKAIGTEIEWFQGKCLTQKILKRKPKKGSKTANPITKTEKCDSFFNFFDPPQIPEDDEIDRDVADELQSQMERDYDIGSTIRDQIIPRAVSWFTGEAAEGETEDEDDMLFEDLDNDDDDEDDDEDEDDEEDEDSEDDEEEKWGSA